MGAKSRKKVLAGSDGSKAEVSKDAAKPKKNIGDRSRGIPAPAQPEGKKIGGRSQGMPL